MSKLIRKTKVCGVFALRDASSYVLIVADYILETHIVCCGLVINHKQE